MNIQTTIAFFKWCTIINAALLIISALIFMSAPEFVYGIHGTLFNLPREGFETIFYCFLGGYKILILVFNLVPWIALLIVRKKREHAHTDVTRAMN